MASPVTAWARSWPWVALSVILGSPHSRPSAGGPMSPERDDLAPTEAMPPALSHGHERFLPGTVLGNRYRIVALSGRGGMGEVYRADDLKIGQPVALKFLSSDLERDPERPERLFGEG